VGRREAGKQAGGTVGRWEDRQARQAEDSRAGWAGSTLGQHAAAPLRSRIGAQDPCLLQHLASRDERHQSATVHNPAQTNAASETTIDDFLDNLCKRRNNFLLAGTHTASLNHNTRKKEMESIHPNTRRNSENHIYKAVLKKLLLMRSNRRSRCGREQRQNEAPKQKNAALSCFSESLGCRRNFLLVCVV
jgi:hypothetical protein